MAENANTTQNNVETATENTANVEKVDKAEFEKVKETASKNAQEVARYKKELEELKKSTMTEQQLKEQALAEEQAQRELARKELENLKVELAKSTIISLSTEAKTKIGIEDSDKDFNLLVDSLTVSDKELAKTRGAAFNKIILAAYKKGCDDTACASSISAGQNINSGGTNQTNQKSDIAKIREAKDRFNELQNKRVEL